MTRNRRKPVFDLKQEILNTLIDANGKRHTLDEIEVPGMGLGASPEAKRWAAIGMVMELVAWHDQNQRPRLGRPRKEQFQTKDAAHAYACWNMCQRLRARR